MMCSNCGHKRGGTESVPDWQCPACKMAYNKHTHRMNTNEYDFQLFYRLIARNKDIDPKVIYLYLKGEDLLEYALRDQYGNVKRKCIYKSELNNNYQAICSKLKNSNEIIDKTQIQALSSYFCKKGYILTKVENDSYANQYRNLIKKKSWRIVMVLVVLGVIMSIFFISNLVHQGAKGQEQNRTQKKNIRSRGVDLSYLSSRLYVINALVSQCRKTCQEHLEIDSGCKKSRDLIRKINPNVSKYKRIISKYREYGLNPQEEKMVVEIDNSIKNILSEIRLINLCRGSSSYKKSYLKKTQKRSSVKKLDLKLFGFDLKKIHSDFIVNSKFLEKCANNCMHYGKKDVNCRMYNSRIDINNLKMARINKIVKDHGFSKFTDENQYILKMIGNETKSVKEYIRYIRKNCENIK